ncbi:MAG: radical SAM protein [Candidatus Aenigmatarchaeota archaeon]
MTLKNKKNNYLKEKQERDIALVEITPGFQCNNNCLFCSINPDSRFKNKSTEQVKKDILDAKKVGAEVLGFTGGEPTIREDIFELVSFAKKQGFRTIRIQTNGRMFSYKEFTKKIIDSGANYFKFSIHGHRPEIHDYLTQVPGSFDQAIQGIKNIKELGRIVEVNILINKVNYKFLPQLVKFLIDLGISRFVLIFCNYFGNAYKNKEIVAVSYTNAVPYIKDALDIIEDYNLDKAVLMFVPICFMTGYEKFVTSDLSPFKTEVKGPDFDVNLDEKFVDEKRKLPQCNKCIYGLICSGVRIDYLNIFGSDEIHPVLGKKIKSLNEIVNYPNREGKSMIT